MKLFDKIGNLVSYEIVDIQDLDSGKKSVIKLSDVIGRSINKKRQEDDRMYS